MEDMEGEVLILSVPKWIGLLIGDVLGGTKSGGGLTSEPTPAPIITVVRSSREESDAPAACAAECNEFRTGVCLGCPVVVGLPLGKACASRAIRPVLDAEGATVVEGGR